MKTTVFGCLVAILAMTTQALPADDIYALIQHGQWQQASDQLGRQGNIRENGTLLFFESLLEPNGNRAARLMRSALERQVDRKYQEEIYFRLTQYYLLIENPVQTLSWAREYQTRWDKGKYRAAILRMVVLAHEFAQHHDSAAAANAQYLKQFGSGDAQAWGLVDNIRIALERNQLASASGLLEDVLKGGSEIATPQIEYLLALAALEGKNKTTSAGYLTDLEGQFPDAIGLDVLRRRVGTVAAKSAEPVQKPAGWLRAEEGKLPWDFSIYAGAYLTKSAAKKQAERMKGEKSPADIETVVAEGKKYYVVYVGRFKSREEVEHMKQRLEQQYGERYQVVTR